MSRLLKIKIITGFREDQYFVIDADEVHKAYYLFTHPEERGIFKNGVPIIGKTIQGIAPAWNETMDYTPTHRLTDDDWIEIKQQKIDKRMNHLLMQAKNFVPMVEKNHNLLEERFSPKLIEDITSKKLKSGK